jgi:hypothetical protein
MMKKLKAIADKYVIGAYDDKTKALLGSVIVGRMFLMFQTYMTAMMANAFQKETYIDELGSYKLVDKDGIEVAEWEKLLVEGYVTTLVHGMSALTVALKTGDFEQINWERLPAYRKRNYVKLIVMAGLSIMSMYIYNALVDGLKDDDDDDKVISEYRIVKNFKYALVGLWVFPNMISMIDSPWAAFGMIRRAFYDKYGNHKWEYLMSILPLNATYRVVDEFVEGVDNQ